MMNKIMLAGKKNQDRNKRVVTLLLALILLSIPLTIYIAISRQPKSNGQVPTAKTTSTAPTAQEDFTSGTDRPAMNNTIERGSATVTESPSEINQLPPQSEWITSQSGEITLYSPSKNQIIKNGDLISGVSALPKISYRIIDNISGVISSGDLTVVNGKFSGSISLTTTASEGRLDVFGRNDDLTEFSIIEVGVRFKE